MENYKHKYNLRDTVVSKSNKNSPGIVRNISIVKTREIDELGEKNNTRVSYGVQINAISHEDYEESKLLYSKRTLHNNAFQIKVGNVILWKDKGLYVIEDAVYKEVTGCVMEWHVKARKLSKGKYNPKGKVISFLQEIDKPVNIVGNLERIVDFK